tara:strand:+ start:1553 stop:2041 length:489 start_codon:yes stop_codon:yes gene_type:complete
MKKITIYFSLLVVAFTVQSQDKRIEDCTLIIDNNERLSCFDSFFQTDKKQILVNQEDVEIFIEKDKKAIKNKKDEEDSNKLIVKAPLSVIEENLSLNGIRLSGGDFIFELNNGSFWRSIENVRKKDIPTPGDKVELQPGIFGSTFLKIKGTKTKIRIKAVKK